MKTKEINALRFILKRKWALFAVIPLISSCQEDNPPVSSTEDESDWIRLEIPEAKQAYAVFGDIDQTLAVTTLGKGYYTIDAGETWHLAEDFRGVVFGLQYADDTLFALHSSGQTEQSDLMAGLAQHYSLDTGKTWHDYRGTRRHDLGKVVSVDTSSAGTVYQLRSNSTGSYVNPSDIIKKDQQGTEIVSLPHAHYLHSLYLDQQDRLYIAAAGDVHNPEDNTLFCCHDALIYVSRRPVP